MKLLLSRRFQSDLENILVFYSQKSFETSENFYNSLFNKIKSIEFMPYRFRKNRYFHKDNVRDLIFNGYVIPFIIDDKTITILAIYKQNLPKFQTSSAKRRERPRHYYFVFLLSSLPFISSAASRSSCAFLNALRALSRRLEFLTLGSSA